VDPLAEQLLDELRAQAASNLKSCILRQLESSQLQIVEARKTIMASTTCSHRNKKLPQNP